MNYKDVATLVVDAGGKVVGRTKLQKIGYFLEVTGLGTGFSFEYKHYGPYSEALAASALEASLYDVVREDERSTSWGGFYSVYSAEPLGDDTPNPSRVALATTACEADSVELELAATALFLFKSEVAKPWAETQRRKPEKSEGGRLVNANLLYEKLRLLDLPVPLPEIPFILN